MRASPQLYIQTSDCVWSDVLLVIRAVVVFPTMVAAAPSASKASKVVKASASHPPFAKMIIEAIVALKEKGGSSRQAILKYIKSHYKVDERVAEVNVRRVLVSATASGKLIRVKGAGASGSFKVAYKAEKAPVSSNEKKPKKAVPPKSKGAAGTTKKPVVAPSPKA
ncbi:unnamed protein product, partial [Hydatigera taeniaeformis]|uniref:H15 domain-containing protein n=1 Tax=Hydatigena taeniaeformis TaxID=6205 RepID=A0A0R3WTP6_HYDTA